MSPPDSPPSSFDEPPAARVSDLARVDVRPADYLDGLNPEQREAVVLKVYEGFKFDEMAEVLGCPVSTVKSRLYTALDLLKTELAPVNSRSIRGNSC